MTSGTAGWRRYRRGATSGAASAASVRRWCRQVLSEVPPPDPFSVSSWVAAIEAHRQRPIRLCPVPGLSRTTPCGLWFSLDDEDYILYEAQTSPLHAEHIILHELAHVLAGHDLSSGMDSPLRLLMPDLDMSIVTRVLGRERYTTRQEQEAELLASMVGAGRRPAAAERDGAATRIVNALACY